MIFNHQILSFKASEQFATMVGHIFGLILITAFYVKRKGEIMQSNLTTKQ